MRAEPVAKPASTAGNETNEVSTDVPPKARRTPTQPRKLKLKAPPATAAVAPASDSPQPKQAAPSQATVDQPPAPAVKPTRSARNSKFVTPQAEPASTGSSEQAPGQEAASVQPDQMANATQSKPAKHKLTPEQKAPSVAQKRAEKADKTLGVAPGKMSTAKPARQANAAKAQAHNLELFPIEATEAPKKTGKLEVAVSVNRRGKKK
jgi:hypothetical protein